MSAEGQSQSGEEAEQADRVCFIDGGRVVAAGTPAELKAALVDEYIVVDADNRIALDAELTRMGLAHTGSGPFRLPLEAHRTHEVLRAIHTPLTVIRTHAPTLEDAYLEIVARADQDAANA